MVADPHLDAVADQLGRDVGLDVGEPDHEIRLAASRISPIFALVNALTFGFSLRAAAGRTVKPLMPTMRSCSPSAYSVSVGSSVRQTMRDGAHHGYSIRFDQVPVVAALVQVALVQAELRAVPELHRARHDAEPAPARRPRHVAALEIGARLRPGALRRFRARPAFPIGRTPTRPTGCRAGARRNRRRPPRRPRFRRRPRSAPARPASRAASGTAARRADWPAARGPCGRRGACRRRNRARRAPSAARCATEGAALRVGGRDDHGGGVGFARRRGLREQVVEGGTGRRLGGGRRAWPHSRALRSTA